MKKPLVLIGQSGSGKTTLANLLSRKLNVTCIDIDSAIEKDFGKTPQQIIESEGVESFRKYETEELESALLSDYPIISAGGGLITTKKNLQILRKEAVVVWLNSSVESLAKRLHNMKDRPLLDFDNLEESLRAQKAERLKYYMIAANVVIDVSNKTQDDVLIELVDLFSKDDQYFIHKTFSEWVHTDESSYQVLVENGATSSLKDHLIVDSGSKAAIITQEGIGFELVSGVEQEVFIVRDGEIAKRLSVVEAVCSDLIKWGLNRNDLIISVGGGVVTDLAGFIASIYHRGIDVVHVPTSLLAQIDAAIGGKCGVNLDEGKNLVGSFWQPKMVICDPLTLDTLPVAQFTNGLGELAKYRFIRDSLLKSNIIQVDLEEFDKPFEEFTLNELVALSVRIKSSVVSYDEKDLGLRSILNYGHTLAHALENITSYQIPHGTAVAIGLVYAAELAYLMDRITLDRLVEHRSLVSNFGLPVTLPASIQEDSFPEIIRLFGLDKKATLGTTFVLDGEDGLESVLVSDQSILLKALHRIKSEV